MRLWHSKLIRVLDNKRLCDVHMSCCNLRGLGWGKRNVSINYIYDDPLGEEALVAYHHMVLAEMQYRGMSPDKNWWYESYCGKNRPARKPDYEKYLDAFMRNVPLRGHTEEIFLNDVKTLHERGHYFRLATMEHPNSVTYIVSQNGRGTSYVVRR